MNVTEIVETAREAITVRRVFAEPYEKDGLTVIAAARVSGGAGGGVGTDANGQQGEGGGFGASARPVGAYVIKQGGVTWRPAVDVNRLAAVLGVVAVVFLLRRPRRSRRAGRRGPHGRALVDQGVRAH